MGSFGTLRVVDGARRGASLELRSGENTMGRSPDRDLRLDHASVSRVHARVVCDSGGVFLEAQKENNPPQVNGVSITGRHPLKGGEKITLGEIHLVYEAPPPPPPPRAAAPPARGRGRPSRARDDDDEEEDEHLATIHARDATPEMLRGAARAAARSLPEGAPCLRCGHRDEEGARSCSECHSPRDTAGPAGTHMMRRPWVIVAYPGGITHEEVLALPEVKFGRHPDNDIVVDFLTVSKHHLVFRDRNGHFEVQDLGSLNGTQVNGKKLEGAQLLHNGDILRIGDRSGNSISLTYHEEGADVRSELGTVAIGRLQVEGRNTFILGRDPQSDVPLEGSLVSWRHARVDKVGDGHAITDLGSTNGTFVNGEQVYGRRTLATGDVIQIGPFKFIYTAAGFSKSTNAGSVRVDAVKVRLEVGAGPTRRVLLNDISLSIKPREFVAFVGGSGAGKSTLMKALAGISRVDGRVVVNGDELRENYDAWKGLLGYVPQDDIVHGDLTVDQAVRFSARLRLPKDTTAQELERAIQRVLDAVEMSEHRDKLIRSLSGGQRKRVSIAVEMLSEPSLFFLDEPTSGLDPGLEKKFMYMMRQLADGGRTIVMVTHATANIVQCDHVAFLSKGHLVWFGPPEEAKKHFGKDDFSDIYNEIGSDPEGLAKRYRASPTYRQYVVERQRVIESPAAEARSTGAGKGALKGLEKRSPGILRQFGILMSRYTKLVFRDRLLLGVLLLVMPFIGLMLGAMASKTDLVGRDVATVEAELLATGTPGEAYLPAPQAEKLLFMTALAVVLLGLFGAAYEVVKERPVYRRERMVNLHIGPYLLSKFIVLFGFSFIQCALLLGTMALFVDIPSQGILMPGPVELYVTLVLTAGAAILMGLLVSSITPNANAVIYLILLVVFSQILLTGTIFKLPSAASPLSYGMVTRWSLEGLGSSANLPRLNEDGRYLLSAEINEEFEVQPEQLGEVLAAVMAQNQMPPPKVPFSQTLKEVKERSVDLEPSYDHSRDGLYRRWMALAAFGLLLFVGAAITLAVRDRREG